MSTLLKKKIAKSLEVMNGKELKQAWLILKEIGPDKNRPVIGDKKKLNHQLSEGIRQLEKGEGTDFSSFIGSLKKKYAVRIRSCYI